MWAQWAGLLGPDPGESKVWEQPGPEWVCLALGTTLLPSLESRIVVWLRLVGAQSLG